MFETLKEVQAEAIRLIVHGATNRRSDMHTPVVGSADGDMRVMVLREYDAASRALRFHTDARSPKSAVIGEGGSTVNVLLYDREAKTQIRARGMGRIECVGPVADAAWKESTNFARRCYLAEDAPGTVSAGGTSGLPGWAEGIQPSDDQIAPARENFAVLMVKLDRLDWLYLANSGHRRAVFTASKRGDWDGQWVVP